MKSDKINKKEKNMDNEKINTFLVSWRYINGRLHASTGCDLPAPVEGDEVKTTHVETIVCTYIQPDGFYRLEVVDGERRGLSWICGVKPVSVFIGQRGPYALLDDGTRVNLYRNGSSPWEF